MFEALNERIANSAVGRYFELKDRKSSFSIELRAGTVTFLTVAYILAVNAGILTDTGGPCSDADCSLAPGTPGCRFNRADPGFQDCLTNFKRSIIAATAASSMLACLLMGVFANLPLAVAPGMGINAFFTYNVVGYLGTGHVSYQQAMAAVFVEGFIFIAISLSGARGKLIQLVPRSIMLATGGGIGLFLAFIGLQQSEGLALVTGDSATLVTLGGCTPEHRSYWYTPTIDVKSPCLDLTGNATALASCLGPQSPNYFCDTKGRMRSSTTWLGIMGGVAMVVAMSKGVRGAVMVGILFVTFISWIPDHQASYLGAASQIPGGADRMEYFKKVATAPTTKYSAVQWDWAGLGRADVWAALFSFLYLDFLDTTGTLFSMAKFIDTKVPGFINERKEFPRQMWAFLADGTAIVIGALLGTSPLTVYIESATGIKEGGRTGITAITVAFFFFIALFFTPILASIPPFATGPALILVGALMMENIKDIEWHEPRVAVPAFVTMAIMPLTYSIAYGVVAGLGTYLTLHLCITAIDLATAMFRGGDVGEVVQRSLPSFMCEKPEVPEPKFVAAAEVGKEEGGALPTSK